MDLTFTSGITLAIGLFTVLYVGLRALNRKSGDRKALLDLPIFAQVHHSPIEKPLVNWDAWTKENGPIAVPKLFGLIPIVVLSSFDAVTELFSRRSQWYSNRPSSVSMEMITDAKPGESKFTLMHDYDDKLKLLHRILSASLGSLAAPKVQPLIELEIKKLLFDLKNLASEECNKISTEAILPLLERTQSSVILGLHYGFRITHFEDNTLQQIMDIQSHVTHMARSPLLPDLIPPLRHLPSFISPWKRSAIDFYARQEDLYMRLLDRGKTSPGWNVTKQAIASGKKFLVLGVPELDLAFTLATSIQGGMETSPRQLQWLFIAALQDTSLVVKAHAVLDEVVGRDRLPRFSDRTSLLFIDAIAHELSRWRPIAPGAIPRRADKDDEYNGVKIKKGWTVLANAWAIGRDPKVFDPALGDVHDFVPERWITSDDNGGKKLRTDLPLPMFGQGRRMCTGKKVATDASFMQIASLLWAFDIEPADNELIDPWEMVVIGFLTTPKDAKFKLKPRGDWVVDVINQEWKDAEKGLGEVMGATDDIEN